MTEPIAQPLLDRARRQAKRRIAACLVNCMADTDTSFEQIAKRLGRKEETVRRWLDELVDAKPSANLDEVSDFLLAMAAELVFTAQPCPWLNEPDVQNVQNIQTVAG
jgi:hypothetical protein